MAKKLKGMESLSNLIKVIFITVGKGEWTIFQGRGSEEIDKHVFTIVSRNSLFTKTMMPTLPNN